MSPSPAVLVRVAHLDDLSFVSSDGYVPQDVVKRKIECDEIFVAERGGEQVGYVRLEYLWSLVPYIALIRVAESHRRTGIGRALLAHIEAALESQGHTAVYSSSQADESSPQEWHRHMGFKECGIIAGLNEGGVGEVFFRKTF